MYIFQSEQVINCDSDFKITLLIFKSPDLIHWSIMWDCGCYTEMGRCIRQNQPTLPSWGLPCYRYGMICHRSSLIRQSCHFERDLDSMLLQLANT